MICIERSHNWRSPLSRYLTRIAVLVVELINTWDHWVQATDD